MYPAPFKSKCSRNKKYSHQTCINLSVFEIYEIKHNFFVDNYKEPIFENRIQYKHMVMLKMNLKNKL